MSDEDNGTRRGDPERTLEQRRRALAMAVRVRKERAEMKRRISEDAGAGIILGILEAPPPCFEKMQVKILVRAIRGVGVETCRQWMAAAQLNPATQLVRVGARRAAVLRGKIEAFAEREHYRK